jgi:hypothetical protein
VLFNSILDFDTEQRPPRSILGPMRLREFSGPDYFAFLFSVSIRSLAAGPDEAGFWPVISWPSATV